MTDLLFQTIGALGVLLISWGVLDKHNLRANLAYLFGGVCLESYSIYLGDPVFIAVQAIFIVVVSYKLFTLQHQKIRR